MNIFRRATSWGHTTLPSRFNHLPEITSRVAGSSTLFSLIMKAASYTTNTPRPPMPPHILPIVVHQSKIIKVVN